MVAPYQVLQQALRSGVGGRGEFGEDVAEFAVGGGQSCTACLEKEGRPAGVGGEGVDVAVVALHHGDYFFEFGHGLVVGHGFNGGEFRCCHRFFSIEVVEPLA